ncbi:chemotaxis protein [Escherichia coli]|nr:chemotaxis protein [Escherichia coli]EFN9895450.1 chemotaxis protein [Escherichia coli]EFO3585304.1 chemotaxis protein [Escherichia coli]
MRYFQLRLFFTHQTNKSGSIIFVTNGAIVIHTQRLKSDPGGNLLS